MGNVMAYSGITTKVRAMSAKLLTAGDYDTIAGLGTVTEAIEYLKDKTAYAPYVNRMDISLYHRGNVEKILYQSLFDDYSRLFRFAGMKQKTFLKLSRKLSTSSSIFFEVINRSMEICEYLSKNSFLYSRSNGLS